MTHDWVTECCKDELYLYWILCKFKTFSQSTMFTCRGKGLEGIWLYFSTESIKFNIEAHKFLFYDTKELRKMKIRIK